MKFALNIICTLLVLGSANYSFSQNYVDTLNAARRASNNGEYRKALKYYKSTERIKPKDLDLSQEMGQTAYKAGDYETAKRCFDELSSNSKTSKQRSVHHTDAGISSLGNEDYKGAEEDFKKALRENPKNEKARQLLMEAKRKRKQKEQQEQGSCDKPGQKGGQQKNNQGQGQGQGEKQENKKQNGNPKNGGDKQNQNNEGTLEDKQTERRLDELMKQEADARRRMNGNNGNSQNKHADKDW